ncbi:glycoside hydrolase family 63 protein [Cucurbitaria berberidis CBS 394.84]|uniref:Mannosyl-oligosaccharide glucosidase n=1 Tax=Cucurbitaria berberidis CBS 394.84 TaxID=1168544 RepID=A0A9P4GQN3_9PLEO|nr:glycoside hydrolase family 63 protein [Cucurbitaria berberidis CBS 394.84]KAF1849764.1 glycoside hydrolase family 63 protein [Cucurbitaria berberidis CBS 394.84]
MQLPTSLLALLSTLLIPNAAAAAATAAIDSLPSNNASLLWGPYRPNLYLGIRPRVPDSLIAGLMWGKLEDVEKKLRHTVDMTEGMAKYGWTAYDTREGGRQIIEDVGNKINITTEFIKSYEGQSAGNWGLRIAGIPRKDAPADLKTTVVFYVGMEAMESCVECRLESKEQLGAGEDTSVHAVNIDISHPRLGSAGIHISTSISEDGRNEGTVVKTLNVTEDRLWQAKSAFLDSLKDQTKDRTEEGPSDLVLRNAPGAGNMQLVQMICHGKFEFDVLYSSHIATRAMTSAELTRELDSTVKSFEKNFVSVYGPKAPFNTDQHLAFSEAVFSNLLGGLGYFVGTAKVDTSKKAIYAETTGKFWEKSEEAKQHATPETRGPYELLTHTPSRAMFPRGFLWDEGFHLLPVLEWDADLALEVVRNWLALMDDDGWIAREQVLGAEAESATPADFITQLPHIANPPTMFLVISKFIDLLAGKTKYFGHESKYLTHAETGKALVAKLYPLLKKHYEWFRKSQSGDVEVHSIPSANLNEGYRWRGRTPETNYASGLDDFPRAEPPDITELHLDALCWVGLMARTLEQIAFFTETTHDAFTYQNHIRGVKTNLENLHWEQTQNIYCDTVVRDDVHTYACHKGYVSIFPFLTGFVGPDHPHLPAVLDLLRDPKHLWTDHGVRSLSPESKKYGVGDNYWRSPIWVNFNYLIVSQLLTLAQTPGPSQQRCREIYVELRSNIVHTVFSSWLETGYVWEQYDPVGGHGQRTQHFTGWTALVVKIMAMPNLAQGEGVTNRVKGYYEEAKKQAVENQRTGAGSVLFAIIVMAFLYVTRRRFAGTLRSWKRRN